MNTYLQNLTLAVRDGWVSLPIGIVRSALLVLTIGLAAPLAHSQVFHKMFMQGQVMAATDDRVVICIGSRDGASAGQTLDVYEFIYEGAIEEGTDNYRRELTGQITIEAIIDEHFARAKIINGEVEVHDMAEMQVETK